MQSTPGHPPLPLQMEYPLPNMGELNLTMLPQGRRPEDQLGYHTAFEALAAEGTLAGYRPFPYRNAETEGDWTRLFDSVIEHMRTSGSNALLLQYFHGRSIPDPRPFIERVRILPQHPVAATPVVVVHLVPSDMHRRRRRSLALRADLTSRSRRRWAAWRSD